MRSVGSNGGHAAAFTYDLARSIVETRQGNPAWSGDERDSSVGGNQLIRSDDLFFGAKTGDVQPDWVDLNKVAIPQADEQQHLLTNLIEQMNVDRKPLPRFWFLPHDKKAAVVMTGDDHGNGGTVGRFQQYQADSPPGCSVADWQCVRGTSYVYPGTPITDSQAAAFQSQGFEIALHSSTNCADFTSQAQLESFYSSQLAAFAADYPSLNSPVTNRTHCIAWSDWATQPKVELENGIRLDTNYYYWPGAWIQDRPGMFTGSGMPMRFADLDGSMIDVYQAATQMTDESDQTYPKNIDSLLNNALGPQGYYGVFTANMHTDSASSAGSDAIVASAQSRGRPDRLRPADAAVARRTQPVLLQRDLLEREHAQLHRHPRRRRQRPPRNGADHLLGWSADHGEAERRPDPHHHADDQGRRVRVLRRRRRQLRGHLRRRQHRAGDLQRRRPRPRATARPTSPGTPTRPRPRGSTTAPARDRSDQNQSSPGLITSHSVQLTGLAPNTTYYYRVTSADAVTPVPNSSTSPEPPAARRSFTTPSATFTDTTVSDFGAGTPDANTYISETGNGEVILKPTEGQEFSGGPGLPSRLVERDLGDARRRRHGAPASRAAPARRRRLRQHHRDLRPRPLARVRGHLRRATFQHVGFTENFNSAWAMFSTRGSTSQLYARTNTGGGPADTPVGAPGQYVGSPHLYRIEWDAGQVQFYIDGDLVHTASATFGTKPERRPPATSTPAAASSRSTGCT